MVQSRANFAEHLWAYGEDELALVMLDTDDETFRRVMAAAGDPAVLEADGRQSWSVTEMAALGAVQVLTGAPRYLQRKRRRPEGDVAEFWIKAGRRRPEPNEGMTEAFRLDMAGHLSE